VPWGVARIESNLGKQVTKPLDSVVAVLDTGIDDSHPDLVVAGGVSWVGTDWRDRNGHGGWLWPEATGARVLWLCVRARHGVSVVRQGRGS
jgi:hypothetical protein